MESQANSVAPAESGTPPARRLVIRIKLPSEGLPPAPVRRRLSRSALLLILGVVAVALSWVGISLFRTDPAPAPAATPAPVPPPSEAAPVVSDAPLPPPATETAVQPDAPPSPINEVIPDVSRSARETIRGTIRVSVRVIVDKQGAVLGATADEPGPSRYFERLSVEAAKKWTFTPADSAEPRVMLVRFYFKRTGTSARAKPLE